MKTLLVAVPDSVDLDGVLYGSLDRQGSGGLFYLRTHKQLPFPRQLLGTDCVGLAKDCNCDEGLWLAWRRKPTWDHVSVEWALSDAQEYVDYLPLPEEFYPFLYTGIYAEIQPEDSWTPYEHPPQAA